MTFYEALQQKKMYVFRKIVARELKLNKGKTKLLILNMYYNYIPKSLTETYVFH